MYTLHNNYLQHNDTATSQITTKQKSQNMKCDKLHTS